MTATRPGSLLRGRQRHGMREHRVGAERHVVAVLLDRAERQDEHRPVAVERRDLARGQFFEAHHATENVAVLRSHIAVSACLPPTLPVPLSLPVKPPKGMCSSQ